jgi:hypothetical protein
MHRTDPGQGSVLSSEARAVLLGVDRMAIARREMDAPTAALLSRVHEDLLALIELLESGHTSSTVASRRAPADDQVPHGTGGTGCRVLPGEI